MMLSRVADAIYWMCRYVERLENVARFLEVTQDFVLDTPDGDMRQWAPLVSVTGDYELFVEKYRKPTSDNVTRFLAVDRDYSNSMIRLLGAARDNARSVRETISSEMWETINGFYQSFQAQAGSGLVLYAPSEFCRSVMHNCVLFNGVTDNTLSRDRSWHFANLGRQLERADQISRLLDVKYFTLLPSPSDVNTPLDDLQWSSLLRSVSGFEMFRKRYHEVTVHHIVDFLVLDRSFPRAIHYCLSQANASMHAITGTPVGSFCNEPEQLLGRLCADLAFTESSDIISRGLHEFIDDLQTEINLVGDAIFNTFFALRPVEESLPPLGTDDLRGLTQTQRQSLGGDG